MTEPSQTAGPEDRVALVVGASGITGSAVTEELLDQAGVAMAEEEQEENEVEKFKQFLDHVSADDFDTGDQPSS